MNYKKIVVIVWCSLLVTALVSYFIGFKMGEIKGGLAQVGETVARTREAVSEVQGQTAPAVNQTPGVVITTLPVERTISGKPMLTVWQTPWVKAEYAALGVPDNVLLTNAEKLRNFCPNEVLNRNDFDKILADAGYAHATAADLVVYAATEKTFRDRRMTYALATVWKNPDTDIPKVPCVKDLVLATADSEPFRMFDVETLANVTSASFFRNECVLGVRKVTVAP